MLGTPQNTCFYSKCPNIPTNKCKCTPEMTYFCSDHIGEHVKQVKVTHQIMDAPVSILAGSDKQKSLKKIEKMILELDKARQAALGACNEIMMNLSINLKKVLSKLMVVKSEMIKVKKLMQRNQQISNEFIENLMTAETLHVTVNYTGIIEKIPEIVTFDVEEENKDNFILHSVCDDPNLYIIDMDSLKKSLIANFSKYWFCSAACKVGKNQYFCTGGYSSITNYHGNTSIVDIKNKTQTVLAVDTPRNCHSCIFKGNQVYVFGGYNGQVAISSANKFDLSTKTWSSLPNMPIAAYYTYSALINNKIIIAGHQLAGVYVFDNNAYVKNLNLDQNSYIACDKWVAGQNSLYECINLDKIEWNKYSIVFTASYGSFDTTYKRHKYIYWIRYDGQLWRIDTEQKVAEQVQFS